MIRNFFIIAIILFLGLAGVLKPAAAQTTTIFQKTVESLNDLFDAKNSEGENLPLRLQILNQVIDLSLTEAKELKLKLFNLGQINKATDQWLAGRILKLDKFINYYNEQKKSIATQDPLTLEWVKNTAYELKEWREKNYLPLAEETINFLLIQQEKKAIETARLRFQKISRDLDKLAENKIKTEKLQPIFELMNRADKIIREGAELNEKADLNFWTTVNAVSSAASTTTPLLPASSIRDLVRESLNKIKEAYQIFIEISKTVKELLI